MSCYDSLNSISIIKDYTKSYSKECNDELFTDGETEIIETILPFMTHLYEAYQMLLAQEENLFTSNIFRVITTIIDLIDKVDETVAFLHFSDLKKLFIENFLDPNKKSCSRILYSIILDKSHHIPGWFIETENYQAAINNLYAEIEKMKTNELVHNDVPNQEIHKSKEHNEYDLTISFAENMKSEVSEDPTSDTNNNELIDFMERKSTKKKNLVKFWTSTKTMKDFPLLTKFVNNLMCHSFTSLYIERCFSKSKRTLNYDRLSMTKEHASMLSVMKANLPMNLLPYILLNLYKKSRNIFIILLEGGQIN